MNETRRDELVGRVADTLDARSQLTATELSHRDIYQDASELVEAVTRHRDAEIREALLDGAWLDTLHDELHAGMYWDTDDSRPIPDETYAHECLPYHVVRDQIEARLEHVGLAEGGAEE